MSTDGTTPTDPTSVDQPTTGATPTGASTVDATPVDATPGTGTASTSEGTLGNVPATETDPQPGWITRHTSTLIALMVAVVVAALAVAGVALYRHDQDGKDADTAAAFSEYISGQGAEVETVECDGDTCSAIISNSAYTVLVQTDDKGEQHFGVSAYTGK